MPPIAITITMPKTAYIPWFLLLSESSSSPFNLFRAQDRFVEGKMRYKFKKFSYLHFFISKYFFIFLSSASIRGLAYSTLLIQVDQLATTQHYPNHLSQATWQPHAHSDVMLPLVKSKDSNALLSEILGSHTPPYR